MKIFFCTMIFATTMMLSGCGSNPVPPMSKGQQINDLQDAYKNRAITAEEYKDEKEKVLDQ